MWALTGPICKQVMAGDMDSKTKWPNLDRSQLDSLQLECLLEAYIEDPTQEGKALAILYGILVIWLERNKSRCVLRGMCQQSLGGWPNIQTVLEWGLNCSHNIPRACFDPQASQQFGQRDAMARLKMKSPWGTPRIGLPWVMRGRNLWKSRPAGRSWHRSKLPNRASHLI